MLKSLRIKFIAIIMASVAVVLAIVFSGICFSEYQRSMANVDEALTASINRVDGETFTHNDRHVEESAGSFDLGMTPRENQSAEDGVFQGRQGGPLYEGGSDAFSGPRIGGMPDEARSLVPVAVYAVDESGSLVIVSDLATAMIDDDVLDKVGALVVDADEGNGSFAAYGLLYQKRVVGEVTYVAFADESHASGWRSLAISLVVAALVVLAVFFVIAFFLSKWALRPVEEAWNSQRQFVADASHELKTPLTVILANTSILLKHPEESIAAQSQWIESTQVEAEGMQGLVNEMLELAQVESRADVRHERFDFSDMVAGQTLQFESVAFERGCIFEESIAEGIEVAGDEQRLRKMTSTLIENALKYVDDGGTVQVGLVRHGNVARMDIRNTGSTIAPDDLPHIFDRFYRTDKARTSGAGGYGLGLAIAREIAREHDGDITCESGQSNTTFSVTLPVA